MLFIWCCTDKNLLTNAVEVIKIEAEMTWRNFSPPQRYSHLSQDSLLRAASLASTYVTAAAQA